MIKLVDKKNKFISLFDPKTGFYVRSGVIEKGKDTGVDPFMTTYPQLIDVGIMGSCESGRLGLCKNAGIQCYQDGLHKSLPDMTLNDFKKIVDESKGKVLQIALGGRGNPNKHKDFGAILKYCRDNDIVPNYTTSGLNLTDEEVSLTKQYCGAVAVSWQRGQHTRDAIYKFLDAGCKTNIHYVLGNFSIDEALEKIDGCFDAFPSGINAVVFLAHKPVGLGDEEEVLKAGNPKVKEFFSIIDNKKDFPFKIGFDSCSVPGILNYTSKIDKASIDTCEGARWSMYISADMVALPCSFDQDHRWGVKLGDNTTIQNAWNGAYFEDFRGSFKKSCPSCTNRIDCMGSCPIKRQIVLCDRKEKDLA
ncbi:MAG: SPASM domain-containing protein [Candidatus Kaiserbacteria bacterium]|nr:SPASM domain-containing protein [Candidatus Kaiserbacteria bacterium]